MILIILLLAIAFVAGMWVGGRQKEEKPLIVSVDDVTPARPSLSPSFFPEEDIMKAVKIKQATATPPVISHAWQAQTEAPHRREEQAETKPAEEKPAEEKPTEEKSAELVVPILPDSILEPEKAPENT